MSDAAQGAEKMRARRRKLEQKEKTPPLIDITSGEHLSQDTHVESRPWKTIGGVKLQEKDRRVIFATCTK